MPMSDKIRGDDGAAIVPRAWQFEASTLAFEDRAALRRFAQLDRRRVDRVDSEKVGDQSGLFLQE